MFGFLKEEAKELGSVGRFYKRIQKFRDRNAREKRDWEIYRERIRKYPERLKTWEERTANGANKSLPKPIEPIPPYAPTARIIPPVIEHHFWWLLHNCVAHMLIGIIPIKLFFTFHDWTSRKLNADVPY